MLLTFHTLLERVIPHSQYFGNPRDPVMSRQTHGPIPEPNRNGRGNLRYVRHGSNRRRTVLISARTLPVRLAVRFAFIGCPRRATDLTANDT